jgi:NADPH-dependent curcumin reductase CurA
MTQVKQIIYKSHPDGMPKESDFEIKTTTIDESDLKEGQLYVQLLEVSVDPYLRYRMVEVGGGFEPFKVGQVMNSIALVRVITSKSDQFKKGDIVTGWSVPWQEYSILDATGVQKIPDVDVPLSYHLHSLGMTGLTAYFGLLDICNPKQGEIVLVSAAAGAVGMLVGQIAKLKGCKVYGIAGGEKKVNFVKQLGFDDALDYKGVSNMDDAIKKLCPDGIDVYFDNVGGETLEAVMINLRNFARISLCGSITEYNNAESSKGPRRYFNLTYANAKMEGFLVARWKDQFPKAIEELAGWLKEGKIQEKIDEWKGLENIVPAFIALFTGLNVGKVVVKIAE